MTTTKQKEANRKNAKKSTGPRTPTGKAIASKNALKHGLLSEKVLLPCDEDGKELEAFAARIRGALRPVGELEGLLSERVITAAWRLRRVLTIETEMFHDKSHTTRGVFGDEQSEECRGVGHAFVSAAHNEDSFSKLSRYEVTIERSLYRALHELQRLQGGRAGGEIPPPAVLDVTTDGGGE
ncbi:hypothetical protein N9903_01340 [bacterium]|nr:hypothetical protein [bacterium]